MSLRYRPLCLLFLALLAFEHSSLAAQALAIGPRDVRIAARDDGGYDLFVRKKPEVASILLTESTKDPALRADNFAYRAAEFNEVNGREKRLLNGQALPPSSKLYSLISSTPHPDPVFGIAFRILVPPVLLYGYPWSRSGSVSVGKGTFINIRAFAKPYADYAGAFFDNPYEIDISTRPLPTPPPAQRALPPPAEPKPLSVAPPAARPILQAPPETKPMVRESPPVSIAAVPPPAQPAEPPSPPPDDRTSAKIGRAIETESDKSLDLVVCLDTTESMVPYIDDVKKNLGPVIRARAAGFKSFRVGLVFYKDYWPDEYITRKFPFDTDISVFERNLRSAVVYGGGDIPEAEVEALYSAATEFDWSADRRQIILVSDAPPHPDPRGKILFEDFAREAAAKNIDTAAITEPKTIPPPNPGHPEFENETRRILAMAASGGRPRLLALAAAGARGEGSGEAVDVARLGAGLFGTIPASSAVEPLGPAKALGLDSSGAGPDAVALKAAADAGATLVVVSKTNSSGAFSETVSRLLEASTGKELSRDVVWRARSMTDDGSEAETVFVNGIRVK